MSLTDTIRTTPITPQKSVRVNNIRAITSGDAGVTHLLAYVPLLREDSARRGRVQLEFEMAETASMLMNGVNVTAHAHFVPFLAFERFGADLGRFNRSYMGQPDVEGGDVIPFIDTMPFAKDAPLFAKLGLHWTEGALVNSAVVEAYNTLINHRRRARSTKLPLRGLKDTTLAACFWKNNGLNHIVPDFDQAMVDGEVALNIVNAQLPIKSEAIEGGMSGSTKAWPAKAGTASPPMDGALYDWSGKIFAEMQENGITVSLSNINLAKETAAFAKLRKEYSGLDDDAIIDLLMQGIRVPDQQMAQPMLLDRQSTLFGYQQRFATDSGNLDKFVADGRTTITLNFRTPPMNTGGIILITAEIVPEQLYERRQDTFLTTTDVTKYPNFLRDYLDPEKVAVVENRYVDVAHTDPDGVFGYAPLNHEWRRDLANIGGKYLRKAGDPFSEDRQRIWGVEVVDPELNEDFILASNIHHNVFADQASTDHFEITTLGRVDILGNTVFGAGLSEDTDDYNKLMDQVDKGRIDQANP